MGWVESSRVGRAVFQIVYGTGTRGKSNVRSRDPVRTQVIPRAIVCFSISWSSMVICICPRIARAKVV